MLEALADHWPEYLIEAFLLGAFMVSACLSVAVLEHPSSPVRRRVPGESVRRAIVGLLMGVTAIALIYSPWGARSGAHMNPALTIAFWTLGKISPADAAWYVAFQFAGGTLGVLLCRAALPRVMAHESVAHVVTVPGARGVAIAWLAEFAMSSALMGVVLGMTNRPETAPYTGLVAGVLVAVYITAEAPLSGMSMNPARTFASGVVAGDYRGLWIYLTAPTAAMTLTALVFAGVVGGDHVLCAKINHPGRERCIFRCHIDLLGAPGRDPASSPTHTPPGSIQPSEASPDGASSQGPAADPATILTRSSMHAR